MNTIFANGPDPVPPHRKGGPGGPVGGGGGGGFVKTNPTPKPKKSSK